MKKEHRILLFAILIMILATVGFGPKGLAVGSIIAVLLFAVNDMIDGND